MKAGRPRIDRRAVFASAAAAALLAAAGVGAGAAPHSGGRLRLALSGAARSDSFDPRRPAGVFMRVAALGAVFDTLTEVAADGTLRPELALGWQANADASVWEFTLRRDAVFHNGAGFGAADAVASILLHGPESGLNLAGVQALDPYRIKITLTAGNPDLPFVLSAPRFVMLPHRQTAQAMTQGVGTGLYKVARFHPGGHLLAERVSGHYKDGRAGWFDELELVSITAPQVRTEAMLGEYVDAVDQPASHHALGLLPAPPGMAQAVSARIACQAQIGTSSLMDNYRAPERWWFA